MQAGCLSWESVKCIFLQVEQVSSLVALRQVSCVYLEGNIGVMLPQSQSRSNVCTYNIWATAAWYTAS